MKKQSKYTVENAFFKCVILQEFIEKQRPTDLKDKYIRM